MDCLYLLTKRVRQLHQLTKTVLKSETLNMRFGDSRNHNQFYTDRLKYLYYTI